MTLDLTGPEAGVVSLEPLPKGVSIFRFEDEKVIEHWDVWQEERPAAADGSRQSQVYEGVDGGI